MPRDSEYFITPSVQVRISDTDMTRILTKGLQAPWIDLYDANLDAVVNAVLDNIKVPFLDKENNVKCGIDRIDLLHGICVWMEKRRGFRIKNGTLDSEGISKPQAERILAFAVGRDD